MKIKYLYLLFLLLCVYSSQAQSKHAIFINTGYAFNDKIELKEAILEKSKGYSIDAGFTYQFFTRKFIVAEIGLSGKMIFATGKLPQHAFQATTFRLTAPLKFTYPIPKTKLSLSSGFIFQNNVDFPEFDLRLRDKYAWRVNYLLEVRYLLNPQINLILAWHANLRNIPDPYFINDPKMAIVFGVTKAIRFKRKKKS